MGSGMGYQYPNGIERRGAFLLLPVSKADTTTLKRVGIVINPRAVAAVEQDTFDPALSVVVVPGRTYSITAPRDELVEALNQALGECTT
jgi:hypothetical protein